MERLFGYALEEYGGEFIIFNSDEKFDNTYNSLI